jgi:D-alanyl-D-alanine carboxypeptidase (penicillin-binding protein 5/6)
LRRGRVAAAALALLAVGVATAMSAADATSGRPATIRVVASAVVPGSVPDFIWPKIGQAAVAVRGVGMVGRSPRERPVPIASLTKMMTAFVVLRDHPLSPGQSGPLIRITASDVAIYETEAVEGDSTVKVVAGETLSECQLLEALLLPSADNIAGLLATWDAGSVGRFVAKMNATARSLGLASTHYADASGVNPLSESTAADQARLGSDLMGHAVIRGIVRRGDLRFPVVGKIWNVNPAIGDDGIQGIKSGWTLKAQGCLVTAAFRTLRHHGVLVVTAALGQPGGLWDAALVDEGLLDSATGGLVAWRVATPGATVATVMLPQGGGSISFIAPPQARFAIVWRGLKLTERISAGTGLSANALRGEPPGSTVGEMLVVAPWGVVAQLPLGLSVTAASTALRTGG